MVPLGGRERQVDVDGAVSRGLCVDAQFDVGKQETHVRQASSGLALANLFVGLDAEVVSNAERLDPGIGLLDTSQIRFPVPAELVVEQRARRVQVRVPTVPEGTLGIVGAHSCPLPRARGLSRLLESGQFVRCSMRKSLGIARAPVNCARRGRVGWRLPGKRLSGPSAGHGLRSRRGTQRQWQRIARETTDGLQVPQIGLASASG